LDVASIMTNFINRIKNLGSANVPDRRHLLKLYLLNGFAAGSILMTILFTLPFLIIGSYKALEGLAIIPVSLLTLYFNFKGQINRSADVAVFAMIGMILLLSLSDRRTGTEYLLIPMAGSSVLLFDQRHKIYLSFLLALASYAFYVWFDQYFPFTANPTTPYFWVRHLILVVAVFFLVLEFLFFHRLVMGYTNNLEVMNLRVNRMNEELQLRADILKATNTQLEGANRAKTVFLGNLSHEIRTPLQGIIGFSEILASNGYPEKRGEYARIINKRANDLLQIIDDLLDMSTIESGEVEARPQRFFLSPAVDKIFYTICEDNLHRQNNLRLLLENRLSQHEQVYIDPLHLRQVLINLLNNGIKFTKAGSVKLVCFKERDHILIHVSDTGIGIPADKLDVIFEPFRQVHEGIARAKDGIGLGLAICKKRVEMWSGTIQVDSTMGVGSKFSFTIPLLK
jgi:signal transduction histidine kinase